MEVHKKNITHKVIARSFNSNKKTYLNLFTCMRERACKFHKQQKMKIKILEKFPVHKL